MTAEPPILPPPLLSALTERGASAAVDDGKARYYRLMIERAGGLDRMGFLRDPHLIALFTDAQVRTGAPLSLNHLLAKMRIGGKNGARSGVLRHLHRLVGSGILIRGYAHDCPTCGASNFIRPHRASERIACESCLSPFQLPLDARFAFKLNQIYAMGLAQGALSVLLALLYWQSEAPDFAWAASVLIEKAGIRGEVDLVCVMGADSRRLIVCECKDRWMDEAALHDQIERGCALADRLGAEFCFVTLQPLDAIPDGVRATLHGRIMLDFAQLCHS
ncbi:MAG: hypothetical protein U0670_23080 [Anaerolineae bacterium]